MPIDPERWTNNTKAAFSAATAHAASANNPEMTPAHLLDALLAQDETMTRPLIMSVGVTYAADGDMLEYVCNEDEQDTRHLVGTAKAEAHPSPALLDRYSGEYRFRDGALSSRDFYGPDQIVSVLQGQLYMKDFPLIPQSETSFDSTAGTIEFYLDSSGRVTHFILSAAEGDARYDRTR